MVAQWKEDVRTRHDEDNISQWVPAAPSRSLDGAKQLEIDREVFAFWSRNWHCKRMFKENNISDEVGASMIGNGCQSYLETFLKTDC